MLTFIKLYLLSSTTILEKLGLVDIDASRSQNRLRWFGHVSRNTESINEALKLDVVGQTRTNPFDRESWKKALKKLSTVQPPGRGTEAL